MSQFFEEEAAQDIAGAPVRGRGRPPGRETPRQVLERETILSAKLVRDMREFITDEVKTIKKTLAKDKDMPISARLEVVKALVDSMASVSKTIGDASKWLTTPTPVATDDSVDDETAYQRLEAEVLGRKSK